MNEPTFDHERLDVYRLSIELARSGSLFTRHYVQAPTCGASRCALLTGRYGGASNMALFQRADEMRAGREVPPSLPAWFRQQGYTTVSIGKVSHHPGGRGGPDWNDDHQPEMPDSWDRHLLAAGPWQHPRGWMHGLAHGEIRDQAKSMDVFQALEGDDTIYPDGVSTNQALEQLDLLSADDSRPFFLAFGILRPHLPFGAPARYLQQYDGAQLPAIAHPRKPDGRTTWHRSGEFMRYNLWNRDPNQDAEFAKEVRRHYAACVSYADAQVGRILERLKQNGEWDNTVVILWGDHGWHLGEHAIWGKHSLFEESLRSPLIIRSPALDPPAKPLQSVVESIDIFPTLCELVGLPVPAFVQGQSLLRVIDGSQPAKRTAISYSGNARTIRTDDHRLILHRDGYVELYDHISPAGETLNIAPSNPALVKQLTSELNRRLP
jgi:iduronate 2-sulfatase